MSWQQMSIRLSKRYRLSLARYSLWNSPARNVYFQPGSPFIYFVVLSLSFKMWDLWSWPVVCFYVRGDVIWKEDSVANVIWEQYSHHDATAYRVFPSRYYWRRCWYVIHQFEFWVYCLIFFLFQSMNNAGKFRSPWFQRTHHRRNSCYTRSRWYSNSVSLRGFHWGWFQSLLWRLHLQP